MQDETNICGDRIDYEPPAGLDESQEELYQSAVSSVEDSIAITAEIQEDRKDGSGAVCEPITPAIVNTLIEVNNQSLMPALSVLSAMEGEEDE